MRKLLDGLKAFVGLGAMLILMAGAWVYDLIHPPRRGGPPD